MGWHGLSLGITADLQAIWGTGPDDIFVGGDDDDQGVPALRHWNGVQWTSMAHPGTSRISAIWGTSGSNVYAASGTKIMHYDGAQWTVAHTLSGVFGVSDITGSGPNDVWATGYSAGVYHWNGSTWAENSPPTNYTFTVWSGGPQDVWVAGAAGGLYRYDGSWAAASSDTSESLYDIWGASSDDIFAVGAFGTVIHYDGSAWHTMATPVAGTLTAVWGSSGHDVWASGWNGQVIHYDGGSWTLHDSSTTRNLNGVWGSSPRDAWVVGDEGTLRQYDGGMLLPNEGLPVQFFTRFWASSAHDIFAIAGTTSIYRWDGASWSLFHSHAEDLNGIWGSSPRDLHAVGDNGALLHYNGSSWTSLSLSPPVSTVWHAVYGTDEDNVFAVGNDGHVARYDGGGWTAMAFPTQDVLQEVWAATPDDVYAFSSSQLFHWDGSQWATVTLPGSSHLTSIWGFSSAAVFVTDNDGNILRFDGTQWRQEHTGGLMLASLWGRSATDVFAVGDQGLVTHYDGDLWSPVRVGDVGNLLSITHSFGHGILMSGFSSSTLHRLETAFGNRLACPEYALPPGGPQDVRIQQLSSGDPDFVELVNTGCQEVDLSGFEIRYRLGNDTAVYGHTVAVGTHLQPGGVIRFVDTAMALGPKERYIGRNVRDVPNGSGWLALCSGTCDLSACSNVIDYFEKTNGSPVADAPACASMSPRALGVSGLGSHDAPTRRALRGSGPNAIRSDWSLAEPTRE